MTRLQPLYGLITLLSTVTSLGCASRPAPTAESPAPVGVGTPQDPQESPTSRADPPEPAGTSDTEARCELVCEKSHVVTYEVTPTESAEFYTQQAEANADEVFAAMHEELLACYTKRLAENPKAHAFLTVDVVIGADGKVQRAEAEGGALLGPATRQCMLNRIQQGQFEPPRGGGTLRLRVPITVRRLGEDEAA